MQLDGRSLQEVLLEFFFDPSMATISGLIIPWSMFGSSDLINQPESVRESFTWKKIDGPGIQKPNGKTFFRVKDVLKAEIHTPQCSGEIIFAGDRYEGELLTEIPQHTINKRMSGPPIQLNHFVIQSQEFYRTVKMTRGAADLSDFENIRTWNYFHISDYHDIEDTSLKEYVHSSRKNMSLHGSHCTSIESK